jgi:hypothetical protein
MSTKLGTVLQTATTVPSTPIPADAQHVAVPSTTTQGQIDDLSKEIKKVAKSYYYITDQVVDTVINSIIFLDGTTGGTNIINLPTGMTKGKLTKAPLYITKTAATPVNTAFTVTLKKYVPVAASGYSQDLVTYSVPANATENTVIQGVVAGDTDLYNDFKVFIEISGVPTEQTGLIFVIANPTIELL